MSNIWIYVIVVFVRWPYICLAWQKHWTIHAIFSTKLIHTCHAHRHHLCITFHTTFNDLFVCLESQGQRKAKPVGFILSHTSHLIRMKFDIILKQIRLSILILSLSQLENRMIETTELYMLIPVWMTVIFIQEQSCMKSKTSVLIFSQISELIWIECSILSQPVGLLKLMLNMFCIIDIQGRELDLRDYVVHLYH